MKKFFAYEQSQMNSESGTYISINNCGHFENCPVGMQTLREKGREDYQMIYVKRGSLLIKLGLKEHVAGEGSVVLYRPYVEQNYMVKDEKTSYYWVHFSGLGAERITGFFDDMVYHIGEHRDFEELFMSIVKSYQSKKTNYILYSEGALLSLMAVFSQAVENKSKSSIAYKVQKAIDFINENYTQAMTNDEYAAICGLSRFYFIRLFKSQTGVTPQKYRMNAVMEKSRILLESNDLNLNIREIAEILGFEDGLYFSRIFKKFHGVSPTNYRKEQIENE